MVWARCCMARISNEVRRGRCMAPPTCCLDGPCRRGAHAQLPLHWLSNFICVLSQQQAGSSICSSHMPSAADAEAEAGGVSLYTSKVLAAVQADQAKLEQLSSYKQQLQTTCELLTELPKKLQHKLTVPFGRHAFFPGVLQHANEVHVHLGANYYVHCTAHEAKGILERCMHSLASAMAAAQQKIDQHQARLSASQSALVPGVGPDGTPVLEIRETYEDSESLLASAHMQQTQAPADVSTALQVPATTTEAAAQHQLGQLTAMQSAAVQQEQREEAHAAAPKAQHVPEDEFAQLFARMDQLEALEAEAEASEQAQQARAEEEDASQKQASAAALQAVPASSRHATSMSQGISSDVEPDSDDEDDGVDWAAAFTPVSLPGAVDPTVTVAPAATPADSLQPGTQGVQESHTAVKQQQQQPQSPAASTSSGILQKQVSRAGAAAAAPLKKGFLLGASKPARTHQQSMNVAQAAAIQDRAPGAEQVDAGSSQAKAAEVKQSKVEAFTGEVVEKLTPVQAPAAQRVTQGQVASKHDNLPTGVSLGSAQAPSRVSKFKMMRQAARQA